MISRIRSPGDSQDLLTASALKQFGKYKKEENVEKRSLDLKVSKGLERILHVWRRFPPLYDDFVPDIEWHMRLKKAVRRIDFTEEDIRKFNISLLQYENVPHKSDEEYGFSEKAGIFLSALINEAKETDFMLNLGIFEKGMTCLCVQNKKNVVIQNDGTGCLIHLGEYMVKGNISVSGNVHDGIGAYMKGGENLMVEGNAGEVSGYQMIGGTIHISGDCAKALDTGWKAE